MRWSAEVPADALARVADLLPRDVAARMAGRIVLIPDLLLEIGEHRRRYAELLEAHRATTTSKIAPLTWVRELPADIASARRTLTTAQPAAASPVAAAALTVAGAVERAVDLWTDTEQTRYRRPYLRSLGEPAPLPPSWLARLTATTV